MANLYLMCGVPGSGKSTFLKNKIKDKNSVIISRDEIRFSLLKPNENYFSHEDEVLQIFWDKINKSLAAGCNTFVDQTSLTIGARKKLLDNIMVKYDHAAVIWIDEPLEVCLDRNEMRKGTRAFVPETTIRRMYSQFQRPQLNEGFDVIYYYNSKEDVIKYIGELI